MDIATRANLPLVPHAEIEWRLARFQAGLAAADLPLAVVTHAVDIYYLSGTMPDGWLIVPVEGAPTLLARKSMTRSRHESPLSDIRPFPGVKGLAALVAEKTGTASGERSGRVGLDLDVLPAGQYLRFAQVMPDYQWVDISSIIRTTRAVKSVWEIERHQWAAKQHVLTFQAIKDTLYEGMPETELSAIAEAVMRQEEHQGIVRFRRKGMNLWFCIVGTGMGAAYPHAFDGPMGSDGLHPASGMIAGSRPIEKGVPVMADILGNYQGYHADIARTFCLGEPPETIRRAHYFCREVLRKVEEYLKPGTPWGVVYDEVAAWAAQKGEPEGFMGYGENRVKFFGHGVGLEVDEFPILAHGFTQLLAAGMVVAVEPKAFYPELGPAGLEMSYVITDHGPEPLLEYQEEIIIV